jgi:hypothetical protein
MNETVERSVRQAWSGCKIDPPHKPPPPTNQQTTTKPPPEQNTNMITRYNINKLDSVLVLLLPCTSRSMNILTGRAKSIYSLTHHSTTPHPCYTTLCDMSLLFKRWVATRPNQYMLMSHNTPLLHINRG